MAQKAHPISIRLGGVNTWKFLWCSDKSSYAEELKKHLLAHSFIERFYRGNNFEIVSLRSEKIDHEITYFLGLRKLSNGGLSYARRFSQTLPLGIPPVKKKLVAAYYESKMVAPPKTTPNESFPYPEMNILLRGLYNITGYRCVVVKSNPVLYEDCSISGDYLATFIRDQLLIAAKRKRRLVPLRYFQKIAMYLKDTLLQQCLGIRIQIKGRLPRLGSSGAARSNQQLLSEGQLALQKISTPVDFGSSILKTKSGLSSIKVWVSYGAPVNYSDKSLNEYT